MYSTYTGYRYIHTHTHTYTHTYSLRSLEAWEAQQCSAVVNCELRGSGALELWSGSQNHKDTELQSQNGSCFLGDASKNHTFESLMGIFCLTKMPQQLYWSVQSNVLAQQLGPSVRSGCQWETPSVLVWARDSSNQKRHSRNRTLELKQKLKWQIEIRGYTQGISHL